LLPKTELSYVEEETAQLKEVQPNTVLTSESSVWTESPLPDEIKWKNEEDDRTEKCEGWHLQKGVTLSPQFISQKKPRKLKLTSHTLEKSLKKIISQARLQKSNKQFSYDAPI
jgi:hypothetical protein